MGAFDRAAAARAKMAQVQREMSDRRALRDNNFRQRRAQALDAFKKQGPVMEQVAKHMGELGRRRKQAGGWATEKTEQSKDFVMGFGLEDEEQAKDPYNFRATSRPDASPGGIGGIDDEDESPLASAPPPAPEPEAPPAPEPPAPTPPPRASRRPAPRTDIDDEDDFSNQSSWMQNR
jgi:hypothetical protein